MTFPVVAGTNTSTQTSATSHTVNLPASIAAGDLLIVLFGWPATADDVSTPSGWTQFMNVLNNTRLYGFYRVADGGEGSTLTVTSSSSAASRHNSYRITGYQGTLEVATATGSSTTPNPPNLAPSWGAEDTLWIAAAHNSNTTADIAAPTNYGNLLEAFLSPFEMNSARRELNASSEDPGTFANASNAQWQAATIAIRPAAAGTASKMHQYRRRRTG